MDASSGWSVLAASAVGWLVTIGGWLFASRASQRSQLENLRLQLRDKHFNDLLRRVGEYSDSLVECWHTYRLLPMVAERQGLEAAKQFVVDEVQPVRDRHKKKAAWLTEPKGYLRMLPVDPRVVISEISHRDFELDDMAFQLTRARYEHPETLMDHDLHEKIEVFQEAAWGLRNVANELARALDAAYYDAVAPRVRTTLRQRIRRHWRPFASRPKQAPPEAELGAPPRFETKNGFLFMSERFAPLPTSWIEQEGRDTGV
jgi:hypothetical protein